MKASRTINWTASNGDQRRAEITVEKKVNDKIAYADGYNIPIGKETYESLEIVVYNNNKKVDTTRQKPSVITERIYGKKFYDEMVAKKGYAIMCNRVAIPEEVYKIIMATIAEMEAETSNNEEFIAVKNAENAKEAAALKNAEENEKRYRANIKSGLCPKCGTWCYGDCTANK